jgi:hypothetical protein
MTFITRRRRPMEPCIRVGIDVGCKAHRVGIASPDGAILDEFDISHTEEA